MITLNKMSIETRRLKPLRFSSQLTQQPQQQQPCETDYCVNPSIDID